MTFRNCLISAFFFLFSNTMVHASQDETPILLVGASYASGKMPFNEGLVGPVFGIAINGGSYLDLGQGFSQRRFFVINEAQAGATTFERLACNPGPQCGPGAWDSYTTQLRRALARVANPLNPGVYNAKYAIISMPNDCLHSDAFGIPQAETVPCNAQQRNDVATRLIDLGHEVLAAGLTPIFSVYPKYENLDLPFAIAAAGLLWEISEADYNDLRQLIRDRVATELSDAILVDSWKRFEHLGDGIHPNTLSTRLAVRSILWAIMEREYREK